MATLTVSASGPARKAGGVIITNFTIAATGTYTTSGDTLDLSGISPATDHRAPSDVRVRGIKRIHL